MAYWRLFGAVISSGTKKHHSSQLNHKINYRVLDVLVRSELNIFNKAHIIVMKSTILWRK